MAIKNTGDDNTGNRNSGNFNTGDCNIGDCNTGDCNLGEKNAGYCNSITPTDITIFNKPAKKKDWDNAKIPKWMFVSLTRWIDESNMSDIEKKKHPIYITTGGYLKHYSSLTQAYFDSWKNTTKEDRELTKLLPNFNPIVFEEVFGFKPFKEITKTIVLDGKEIEMSEKNYNYLKEQFNKVKGLENEKM